MGPRRPRFGRSRRWAAVLAVVLLSFASPSIAQQSEPYSTLFAVSCVSTSDCWAVGSYSPPGNGLLSEALHWNGHGWTRVTTPNPAGTTPSDNNALVGVACVSASDCWAVGASVGYSERPFAGTQDLLLHWDGSTWSQVSLAQPKGELSGIACPSASDCWVMGGLDHRALHWNGTRWSFVALPREADTVSCRSPSSCWAVGSARTSTGDTGNVVLRWDGHRWARARPPGPGGTGRVPQARLSAVACASESRCWAVGDYSPPSLLHLDQMARWNGSRWVGVSGTLPGNRRYHPNWLDGIACVSRSDCWAVGAFGKGEAHLNQIQHWNGHGWSLTSVPEPGGRTGGDANVLDGVFCLRASDCWAVGWSQVAGRPNVNEALHWNGLRWSVS